MTEQSGEFDIIRRFFAPLTRDFSGAYSLLDDAACLDVPPDQQLMITTDCLVAGVHFFDTDPADSIAAKLLSANLSDLASMGATAQVYTLAVAWPQPVDVEWIRVFAEGLELSQQQYGVHLIGGDTVASPSPLTLTVTAMGTVAKGKGLLRSTANGGDLVYVSGTIGDAALGLDILNAGREGVSGLDATDAESLIARYRTPTARCRLGQHLVGIASACIDISDGLLSDLGHLVKASGVQVDIHLTDVPLSEAARRMITDSPLSAHRILNGGDDYELLFTVPPEQETTLIELSKKLGIQLTSIGILSVSQSDKEDVRVFDGNGTLLSLENTGYRHF